MRNPEHCSRGLRNNFFVILVVFEAAGQGRVSDDHGYDDGLGAVWVGGVVAGRSPRAR